MEIQGKEGRDWLASCETRRIRRIGLAQLNPNKCKRLHRSWAHRQKDFACTHARFRFLVLILLNSQIYKHITPESITIEMVRYYCYS